MMKKVEITEKMQFYVSQVNYYERRIKFDKRNRHLEPIWRWNYRQYREKANLLFQILIDSFNLDLFCLGQ